VVFAGKLYLKYQFKGSSFRSISSFLILLTPFLRADYKEGVWSKGRSIDIKIAVTNLGLFFINVLTVKNG